MHSAKARRLSSQRLVKSGTSRTRSTCTRPLSSAGERAGYGGWEIMSKESSPHGDTTANTYIDVGAETKEAYEISVKSRTLARKMVGNATPEDRVKQRCSI